MTATTLPQVLTRSVVIRAQPETVFRFFTDSTRFASWWGAGSSIEARPGGAVRIVYPGGVLVTGSVVSVDPVRQISFTYGYETQNHELVPPGGSLVTVSLEEHPEGTMLRLTHDLPTAAAREAHLPGWRYQLAVFANRVAEEAHGGAEALVDRYFAVWSETDAARRRGELTSVATADLVFRDGFGVTASPEDLAEHIGAAQIHMPGLRLERDGALRHCQGTGLANWVARAPDGSIAARGCNVIEFAPDGRLARVVGLWAS
jgi:uncharacterized protein YndB with AHSA1/START domain